MNICDLNAKASHQPVYSHFAGTASVSSIPLKSKPDQIKFGMSINAGVGCCDDKVKTGREGGCCAHIPHEKFVEGYLGTIQSKFEDTGSKPKLDEDMQSILLGHLTRIEKDNQSDLKISMLRELLSAEKDPDVEQQDKRDALSPTRFLKHLSKGFWEDAKLVASGKRDNV